FSSGARTNPTGSLAGAKTEPVPKSNSRNAAAKSAIKAGASSAEKIPQPKLIVPPAVLKTDRNGSSITSLDPAPEAKPAKNQPPKTAFTIQPEQRSNSVASEAANESTALDQPVSNPVPSLPKPIELPAINGAESAIPLASLTEFNAILSTFENFTLHSALIEEPAPPPPAPKLHTRKRRVTVPDGQ